MKHINDVLAELKQGLDKVHEAIETIANMPIEVPEPLNNSISGDKIHGGKITKFSSVGIKDEAKDLKVLVNDLGLHVDNITVKTVQGPVAVKGDLNVNGSVIAQKLHVNELTADVRNERTGPLEFLADEKGIYGKGLQWKGDGPTRQFTYRANPDRIWTSETIDLQEGKSYNIGNRTVLTADSLGSSVRSSELVKVGTLQDLRTQGDLVIDDYIYYNSTLDALGIGTENPNGKFSVATLDAEFIVDTEPRVVRIGAWTTSDLELITDDTTRLTITATGNIHLGKKDGKPTKVSVFGQLGINVNNVPEGVSLATDGPIQMQDKRFEIGSAAPATGSYKHGDVVWNTNPQPTGYMGWVCVREGTPGVWKPFGQIGS